MKLESAKEELEMFIERHGGTVLTLTPADSIRLMLDFYRHVHVDDIPLEDSGGDMLLYQWGTYDWGQGRFFQSDITRQFIVADSDGDDGFRQLALTCYFQPSPEFDALKSGNRWCRKLDDLSGFEIFIAESGAYKTVGVSKPTKISLEYGGV